MKLEGGKIPANQLVFLIIGFIYGTVVIINPGRAAGNDAWLAFIVSMLVGLCFAAIYVILAQRFQTKNLLEINDLVFGPYLGKLISLVYLWYFFHLGAIVLRDFGDFLAGIIFPETPISVFLITMVLICASAVRNGIEVIGRTSIILTIITTIILVLTSLLSIPLMDFNNLLPILQTTKLKEFLTTVLISATFPFGETVVFLMIFSTVNNPKKLKLTTLIAFLFGGGLLLIQAIRNIAVLGTLMDIYTYPSYTAVRAVNIFEVITRIEILVVINFLTMGFIKVTVLYYAVSLGTAQLLKLKSYLPVVLPIGILMICLSLLQFESSFENSYFTYTIYPFYALPFQIFLPLLTLLVAIIRGKKGVPG